jgi:serine protease Do
MHRHVSLVFLFLAGWYAARLGDVPQADAGPAPTSFAGLVRAADPSVVHITTVSRGNARPRSRDDNVGSGFVWDAAGLIVTNRHVISGAARINVHLASGVTHTAQVVGYDEEADVALLRIPAGGLVAAPRGSARSLQKGDWVLAAGSPYRLARSWSVGIVSGLGRRGIGVSPRAIEDYIQTDAAANLGNSGGPLFDAAGQVVGVVTVILSRATGSQGVSLAVPIDVVIDAVTRLQGGAPARSELGLRVRPATGGPVVTSVSPGGPAGTAGLRVGDQIVEVGGAAVRTSADLQRAWWQGASQGAVRFVFVRGGQRLQVTVTPR